MCTGVALNVVAERCRSPNVLAKQNGQAEGIRESAGRTSELGTPVLLGVRVTKTHIWKLRVASTHVSSQTRWKG